jgi:hypothetical protein
MQPNAGAVGGGVGCMAQVGSLGSAPTCTLLVLVVVLCGASAPIASAAPPNDNFADAADLVGLPGAVDLSTGGATREPGEPVHGYPDPPPGRGTVWSRWTAPSSGPVAVQTCGTDPPDNWMAVAVYTGEAVTALTLVGGIRGGSSSLWCQYVGRRVAFFATAGEVYRIAVDTQASLDSYPGPGAPGDPRIRLEVRPAGTVGTRLVPSSSGPLAQLVYRAAAGETSAADVALDWDPTSGLFPLRPEPPAPPVAVYAREEQLALVPGPGCNPNPGLPNGGVITCTIPPGARATGPYIALGDGDDFVHVQFSRHGTQVFGGPGSDLITASGRVRGGPGDDRIAARPWSPARIAGGPGDDEIYGSLKRDLIDPGPGSDRVFTDPRSCCRQFPIGRDLVRTRDRDIDYISCSTPATVLLDGYDYYPGSCGRVERRGAARALPLSFYTHARGEAQWDVQCPPDGPRVCTGSLSAFAHGVTLRRHFELTANNFVASFYLFASRKRLRVLGDDVKVTVRSRDRTGRLRKATGIFHEVQSP